MSVRVSRPGDVPRLVPLFAQLGYPTTPASLARRLERQSSSDYQSWVYEHAGTVIGFAGGHLMRPFEDDAPAAQLMILVVDERYRGHGTGSALVTAFESWAGRSGAARVIAGSGTARTDAHRFYRARGYRHTGLRFGKPL